MRFTLICNAASTSEALFCAGHYAVSGRVATSREACRDGWSPDGTSSRDTLRRERDDSDEPEPPAPRDAFAAEARAHRRAARVEPRAAVSVARLTEERAQERHRRNIEVKNRRDYL